jgi:hypothetical protein
MPDGAEMVFGAQGNSRKRVAFEKRQINHVICFNYRNREPCRATVYNVRMAVID